MGSSLLTSLGGEDACRFTLSWWCKPILVPQAATVGEWFTCLRHRVMIPGLFWACARALHAGQPTHVWHKAIGSHILHKKFVIWNVTSVQWSSERVNKFWPRIRFFEKNDEKISKMNSIVHLELPVANLFPLARRMRSCTLRWSWTCWGCPRSRRTRSAYSRRMPCQSTSAQWSCGTSLDLSRSHTPLRISWFYNILSQHN